MTKFILLTAILVLLLFANGACSAQQNSFEAGFIMINCTNYMYTPQPGCW